MKRNKSYDKEVSTHLQNPKHVAAYLTSLMDAESDLTIEEALRLTIGRMGIKEFCKMTRAERTNVTNFVNEKRIIGPKTLNAYLKPFGLEVKMILQKAS